MAKKKVTGEDGKTYVMKEKKPFYKKVWFWILAVIVVAAIGGSLGGGDKDKADGGSKDSSSAKTETKDSTKASSEPAKEEETESDLKAKFDAITLGDLMSAGEGGASIDEIKAEFGEPSSTSESTIENVTTKMLTWSNLKGADFLNSLVVSFSNDKAVSKAITGLKVSDHDKVTLEQFNNTPTDGTFTIDQAKEAFGEPDSISVTIINGANQELLSWTKNVNGDLGANFNMTFDNGTATSKSNYGMK